MVDGNRVSIGSDDRYEVSGISVYLSTSIDFDLNVEVLVVEITRELCTGLLPVGMVLRSFGAVNTGELYGDDAGSVFVGCEVMLQELS